jgi:hypothetical protein
MPATALPRHYFACEHSKMRRKLTVIGLALAAHAIAACDAERAMLVKRFGPDLLAWEPASKQCAIRADFNGDGTPDWAMLVRLTANPLTLPASIARINPLRKSGVWSGRQKGLAIAISLEGATPRLFLLSDGEYFSTPMWQSPENMLTKIPRAQAGRAAKGDALGVATESGADMTVLWTGVAWRAEASQEAP